MLFCLKKDLSKPHRKFIQEISVHETIPENQVERQIFLFNDLLLVAKIRANDFKKPYSLLHCLPLTDFALRDPISSIFLPFPPPFCFPGELITETMQKASSNALISSNKKNCFAAFDSSPEWTK